MNGRYKIKASAPAYLVESHKAKLANITDTSDEIIGSSMYARNSTFGYNDSTLVGEIILGHAKTFELQHRCSTTQAGTGFGLATTFGVPEIYSQVRIEKIE